jgi:hypothetical protein
VQLKEMSTKSTDWFLLELPRIADGLLDTKEQSIDPVLSFMQGSQKAIYDQARQLVQEQEDNFSYVSSPAIEAINALLADPKPWQGTRLQQIRPQLDALQQAIDDQVVQERATAADTLELFAESLDQSTGQIDAGTLAANTITDATIANDTFTADKFEAGSLDGKGDWNTVAPDNADIAAIKAKTDNLPSDPADASDIASSFSSLAGTLATIVGYIDTEIAAIKAKTDTLPASPANEATLTIIDGIVDAIKVVTDRVNGLIENSTGDRWTAKALETVGNEVGKIPRGASAIAAGGNATKTKISANGTTLVEAIT